MKKTLLLFPIAIILVMSLFLVSCENEPELKSYTVTFLLNEVDTEPFDKKTVIEGASITDAKVPEKTGYKFLYWKTVGGGNDAYDLKSPVKGDLTLVAAWEINKYTVTFMDGEVEIADSQAVEYEKTATAPKDPVKEDSKFIHWALKGTVDKYDFTTAVTSDITLVPVWQIKQYSVVFEYEKDGTTTTDTQTVNHGQLLSSVVKPEPTKTGHVLTGWTSEKDSSDAYDNSIAIKGELKLYPIWERGEYKVVFCCDDDVENVPKTQAVFFEDKATKPEANPTKTGYTFKHWATSADLKTEYKFDSLVVGDLTLYPVWEKNTYTVTFMGGEGISNVPTSQSVKYEEKATEPTTIPTKTGYTFKHWATSADSETGYDFDKTPITKELVLYPEFEINTYTVTFVGAEGIIFDLKNQTVEYNSTASDPKTTVKEGYKVLGWKKEGSEVFFDFETGITSDITLHAEYETLKISVSFYNEKGERLSSSGVYEWGKDYNFPSTAITVPENFELGWIIRGDKTAVKTPSFNLPYSKNEYIFDVYLYSDLMKNNNGSVYATDALKNSTTITSISIPQSIEGKTVTSIKSNGFNGCSNLTSITIPSSVTSIGNYVFYRCTSLTEINVAAENKNYESVNGVLFDKASTKLICYPAAKTGDTYTVPSTVKTIDGYAFADCINLTSINIPEGVTSIGSYTFDSCSSLSSITIPASCTSIGAYAFDNCKSLQTVDIAEGCKSIGNNAFSNCKELKSIVVPSTVTSLGDCIFLWCSSLKSADIKANVTELKVNIFKGDEKLETICLSSNISSLPKNIFVNTPSLQTIEVHADNANFLSIDGVLYDKNKTKLICYPAAKLGESFTIPDTVTTIGSYAFIRIQKLKSIIIPNTVTAIEQLAFYSCKNPIDVYINKDESDLFKNAFDGDSKVKVTIHWNSTGPESQN